MDTKKTQDLERRFQKRLDLLDEISLPDSLEWMDKNLPKARAYIEETHGEILKAMYGGDDTAFGISVEKYEKAWLRVWQLMAQEHFKGRKFEDVDMRYYRHMPDGNNFVMDSKRLGYKIKVFPRKPKNPPEDMKWMTAGELLKIHEAPILVNIMEEFGAWFDRADPKMTLTDKEEAIRASKARAEKIRAEGGGLKFKRKKGVWEYWE
jgi:hypothetical protein